MALDDLTKATPDTSSEEIKAFADQVFKEVEADRKGEPEKKSDAQITNEQAGIPQPGSKTFVETNSDSDTALDGEETGDNIDESPEWLTDEVKAEAAAYGIEEAELADFASREELNRAFRLFDKTALEAGRKALAEGDKPQDRNEKGQFVKKEESKTEASKEATPKDGRYEVSLDPDVYDEGIIGELTRMRDHYESRLEALESHFAEAKEQSEHQQFDALVDSIGHDDLFGKAGSLTDEEFQRRDKLFTELKFYINGRKSFGVPTKLDQQTISSLANMVFAAELNKKLLKQKTKSISRQSNGRMGGSPTKPLRPSDHPRDHFDRLYQEMQSR